MAQIEAIRAVLHGKQWGPVTSGFDVTASRAHGGVQTVHVAMQRLGFASLIAPPSPPASGDMVLAMVASRILAPQAKLATTRRWHTSTPAEAFGLAAADEQDLYAAMDWLLARQNMIEKKLATRHLSPGGLVLYDLSSSYFEGSAPAALAKRGYTIAVMARHAASQLRLVVK